MRLLLQNNLCFLGMIACWAGCLAATVCLAVCLPGRGWPLAFLSPLLPQVHSSAAALLPSHPALRPACRACLPAPLPLQEAAAFRVFELARPTAAQPFIAGLLDPCTNSLLAPNIPAEKLYDKQVGLFIGKQRGASCMAPAYLPSLSGSAATRVAAWLLTPPPPLKCWNCCYHCCYCRPTG